MTRKRCSKRPATRISRLLARRACIAVAIFVQPAFADIGQSVAVLSNGKIVVAGYTGVGRGSNIAVVLYNADGTLDKTFDGTGKVVTAVGDGDCKAEGVAVQSDNKIVVAGYSFKSGDIANRAEFTVLRYNDDGTLDKTFGNSGKVTTDIGRSSDSASSVALQRDGKIVVAGDTFSPGNNDFAVARYNTDGTLDMTFNGSGKATADFSKLDYGRSIAVQSGGKIVVAGDAAQGDGRTFAVARFAANGTADNSFNKTGKVTTDFTGGKLEGRGVAVQNDGKIVVAGFVSIDGTEKFALIRYNPDGTLDTSFGGTGKVLTLVGMSGSNATGVALQDDGKIVASGYAINNSGRGRDFAIVRYNSDGSLDMTFNGSGKVTTNLSDDDSHCEALALEKNGKIIAAGWVSNLNETKFAVARLGADGKLDPSFNGTGKVTTALGSNGVGSQGSAAEGNRGPSMATINDPDGYTNVRDNDNKVIAKVKAGERFIAIQLPTESKEWQVHLKSGVTGLMDKSRIRLSPDEPLMKFNYDASKKEWRKLQSQKGTEHGETASAAKEHGVDYYKTLMRASDGNVQALARIFSLAEFMDGAAAEGYYPEMWELFHIVGDKKFAEFLRRQPLTRQVGARGILRGGLSEESGGDQDPMDYLQRYFPETTKILFQGEVVDWPSPDGRYAIRKTFSNPLDLSDSKVSHAELIEKTSGKAICDLTADDIGTGSDREGSVVWSPDSKRFAYVSSDKIHGSPQKTQTIVYQLSGASCVKTDLPLNQPPGKESDTELTGAAVEHEFVTPVRWENPNAVILEKHDYYRKLTPSSGTLHDIVRLYEIRVSFKEDGTASTSWKLQADR